MGVDSSVFPSLMAFLLNDLGIVAAISSLLILALYILFPYLLILFKSLLLRGISLVLTLITEVFSLVTWS
jgi:hypothetical protein